MAKNTQNVGSNVNTSDLQMFINAGLAEADAKDKADLKGSSAYRYALLAASDVDTRNVFKAKLHAMNDADDKLRAKARTAFADYVGATKFLDVSGDKEKKTNKYNNVIKSQRARIEFAVDVYVIDVRDDLTIEENKAFVGGNTKLSGLIWKHLGWHEKKQIADKRSEGESIRISPKAGDRNIGEVSWAMLAKVVRKATGKDGDEEERVPPVNEKSSPITAFKLVQRIASREGVEVHFSSVESRMLALEAGEDVMAFAFEGDDMTGVRKAYENAVEEARALLRSKMNAKIALQTSKATAA